MGGLSEKEKLHIACMQTANKSILTHRHTHKSCIFLLTWWLRYSLIYSSATKRHTHIHTPSLKCPRGCWSWGAINCTVLSDWPRPAMGSWVGGVDKEGGCLRSALVPVGETPWRARCVAGATHTHTHIF